MAAMDLRKFATWAFGPQGFPGLQVVAYGDLSFGNRYAQLNTLLCRTPNSLLNPAIHSSQAENAVYFQELASDHWNRVDNVDIPLAALEACAVDHLFWNFGAEWR